MEQQALIRKLVWPLVLGGLMILGLWVRLIDLDDPPLDFNPTRQLRSAIIARGIYYEHSPNLDPDARALAIAHKDSMERLEPAILETLVAFTYKLLGAERLWAARVYSSLFWLAGAAALYILGRQMESPLGALLGVGYILFLPFSIRASRSFQPDPLMSALILWTAWALYRWLGVRSWKWALAAGILGGITGTVKIMGLFFTGGMALGAAVFAVRASLETASPRLRGWVSGLKKTLTSPQLWTIVLLMILPALAYTLLGDRSTSAGFFTQWTVFTRWREVLDPSFFMRWAVRIDDLFMIGLILAGLVGTLLTSPKNRALLWSLWGGYFVFAAMFPYHTLTHDYYHLPLVGIIALSLVPLGETLWVGVSQGGWWIRVAFIGVLVAFLGYNAWIGRSILVGKDFRQHPAFWGEVSAALPEDAKVIGVSQDYGFRLMYFGWRKIALWPQSAGVQDFERQAEGAEYFLITAKNQLKGEVQDFLAEHYPLHAQGVGYLVYDLRP